MRGFLAIYRRELAGLFVGPLAWVLLCIALALNGFVFVLYLKLSGGDLDVATRYELGESFVFWVVIMLFPPLLTMRMISEEARSGMLEFLLTAPVSDLAVVCGKFAAALTFMALLWLCVPVYVLTAGAVGPSPDWGMAVGGWIGATLASALFCSVGILSSSLTGTPVVAATAAAIANIVIVIFPLLARMSDAAWVASAVSRIDVKQHLASSFLIGVVDSSYALFFAAWTALFLFMAVRAVEARRWR
jgi:ABC-2 type transport system permease protein